MKQEKMIPACVTVQSRIRLTPERQSSSLAEQIGEKFFP
jgi:hypothetical protein